MNLVIDYGNTRIKAGVFEEEMLKDQWIFNTSTDLDAFLKNKKFWNTLVSSVSRPAEEVLQSIDVMGRKLTLDPSLPVPFKNLYATPSTLGVDRMAAAAGAMSIFPATDCLVIDAGTCFNYEFVDELGQYHGGAISPGIYMRLEAMHKFTARLPLVSNNPNAPLIGNSTETCMQSGVIHGVIAEIEGIIERYRQLYPRLGVILCGGDYAFFENQLKPSIFVAPELVLVGLNRILLHNVRI
jgi:type III pantothenate kinase